MKYNGIDPRTLDPRISIAKEIPPGAPASELETVKGAEGEIVAGRTIKHGEYKVIVNVASRTRAGAWEVREKLAAWARSVDTVTHELIPTHRPERYYDAIFKEISDPEFSFGFGVITVKFAVPRTISKSVTEQQETAADPDGTGVAMLVESGGSSYIRPVLEIETKQTSRLELLVDDGLVMAMNYPFAKGTVLTVQTAQPAVRIENENGAQMAERYLDYTVTDLDELCHRLQPGLHTISCPQADRISATWKDEYL